MAGYQGDPLHFAQTRSRCSKCLSSKIESARDATEVVAPVGSVFDSLSFLCRPLENFLFLEADLPAPFRDSNLENVNGGR